MQPIKDQIQKLQTIYKTQVTNLKKENKDLRK